MHRLNIASKEIKHYAEQLISNFVADLIKLGIKLDQKNINEIVAVEDIIYVAIAIDSSSSQIMPSVINKLINHNILTSEILVYLYAIYCDSTTIDLLNQWIISSELHEFRMRVVDAKVAELITLNHELRLKQHPCLLNFIADKKLEINIYENCTSNLNDVARKQLTCITNNYLSSLAMAKILFLATISKDSIFANIPKEITMHIFAFYSDSLLKSKNNKPFTATFFDKKTIFREESEKSDYLTNGTAKNRL